MGAILIEQRQADPGASEFAQQRQPFPLDVDLVATGLYGVLQGAGACTIAGSGQVGLLPGQRQQCVVEASQPTRGRLSSRPHGSYFGQGLAARRLDHRRSRNLARVRRFDLAILPRRPVDGQRH